MGSSQRIFKLCRTSKKQSDTSKNKMASSGLGKMHLDLYTSNSALTHKAKFWCNYVGALKDRGSGLLVKENPEDLRPKYRPSIWSQYRPVDITMTDLVFDDDWRKWDFWHKGSQDLRAPDD